VSLAIRNVRGLFSRIFGFRSSSDPIRKTIAEAIAQIDRMLLDIEGTINNLKEMQEDHTRKAEMFARQGKNEYERIFLDELDHIGKLLTIFNLVHMDLVRVKVRLKTLTHVEEPLKHLPEIIQELEMIKPKIEKIAPDLAMAVMEIERKVSSIMTSTNLINPPLAGINTSQGSSNAVRKTVSKKALPPLPPETEPPATIQAPVARVRATSTMSSKVSVDLIKTWLIEEIKSTGGVLDISTFCKKYGVTRSQVFMALQMLEREGKIKLSR